MNQYIFFTTEGTTYSPIESKEVDNCQLLGRAYGQTSEEAKSNLLKDNPWIEDSGFDSDCIIAEHVLTEELRKDIQTLVEYLHKDKDKYCEEWECSENHILKTIQRLEKL